MLKATGVSGGYGEQDVVKNVSFELQKQEILGILGPNGSGKTTLMKMISGLLPCREGAVHYKEKPLSAYSAKQLAREVAVLPQLHQHAFDYTVRETVAMGRYPHQKGMFAPWTEHDEKAVMDAMKQTGVERFEHQSIQDLSGGERQRVFLAQALAQEPKLLLLDEPTNHLDLSYQKQLLDLLKEWTETHELTVISIFHDLNIASLYCDRLLLLHHGETVQLAEPGNVMNKETVERVYNARVHTQSHPELPKPQVTLLPNHGFEKTGLITKDLFEITGDHVYVKTPQSLKTLSSAVIGAGLGWYHHFVNRHVPMDYECDDSYEDMVRYAAHNGWNPADTVGMMTAVKVEDVIIREYEDNGLSVVIAVTAGVGNAVDVSLSYERERQATIGTINSWIFINGKLSDEAFIQAMMTATEAKVKALQNADVKDPLTGTLATGTSTDSALVAATQTGPFVQYAGSITPLGKMIGKGIVECTSEAIRIYRERKSR
ncbi:adenosylcobinamide amidohydrolase [Jeotgalibacillus sp. R-1-5s-1]|uniref:adenosylcobinamide amidohydrolase n=1 Tax=Jeotgalibacillus sp. R-1-5s-1 TaxID=2555897 RepID=UPI0010690FFB|nr:adenosylcobinamide amidohydrolase [Jeotgalibacillus sp. R-1-5s-1]TFD92922.1 ATP-binding cassette domain-containing protein [Jeotgalibacillus sp. R-1-5s-1]